MATKSHNIRIDEKVKKEATAVFGSLGLNLSDAVNVFLRKAVDENGFPFEVKKKIRKPTPRERRTALRDLLEFAGRHPALPKNYKFNREESYDRKVFR
jgi:addiction module RelB/DinJ family antitoxin